MSETERSERMGARKKKDMSKKKRTSPGFRRKGREREKGSETEPSTKKKPYFRDGRPRDAFSSKIEVPQSQSWLSSHIAKGFIVPCVS